MSIFLALQLVHNGLYTAAAHTNARTHGVDRAVIRDHSNLGARSGIAGNSLDLDDTVIDFRYFHLEQLGHEFRRGARQEDLVATDLAADFLNIGAYAVIRAIAFATDLIIAAQNSLGTAQIDDDIAEFLALDRTIDDGACAILEFFVLTVTLSFAHLLQDHLLGGLRRDTAHLNRRNLFDKDVTHLGVFHVLLGLFDGHLGLIVLKLFILDHGADAGKGRLACLAVDGDTNVHLGAVAALGGTGERFFHRFDNQTGVDHLFAGHGLGGLQQLQLVG